MTTETAETTESARADFMAVTGEIERLHDEYEQRLRDLHAEFAARETPLLEKLRAIPHDGIAYLRDLSARLEEERRRG